MSNVDKKILERIEKLLRMAADVSSPNEAAIAASRAAKLMDKYQIDQADLVLDEVNSGAGMDEESLEFGKQLPKYKSFLIVAVAEFNDCVAMGKRTSKGKGVIIAGYKYDVQAAIYMYNFLIETINRLADTDYKAYKQTGGTENGRSWKTSYRNGAAIAIITTLKELKKSSEKEKTEVGTSLVVAKKQAIAEHYGNVRYGGSSCKSRNSEAYNRGYEQGRNVKINKAIGS